MEAGEGAKYNLEVSVEVPESLDKVRGNLAAKVTKRGIAVVGWVVGTNESITEVELVCGSEVIALAPVDVERPDVAEQLAGKFDVDNPGFHLILEPDGTGNSELTVNAIVDDDRVSLGEVKVAVSNRSKPLRLHSKTRTVTWTLLSPPPEREKVLFGKEGWLFLNRDTNDVIGQQTGRVKLSRKKRIAWERVLRNRMGTITRRSTRWLCLVIPDKEFVYSEFLPAGLEPVSRRPVHDFLDTARAIEAPVVYALDALRVEKARHQVFSKTDSHWNQRGAYTACKSITSYFRKGDVEIPLPGEKSIEWFEAEAPGGLGIKLYPEQVSSTTRANLSAHSGRLVFDNGVQNHGRVMVFEQEGDGLSCVVFGESFVQNMLLFLKEAFRRLVFVHTSMLVDEIIAAEEPDLVLSVPLERFLVQVPNDSPGLDGLARSAAEKARKGTLASKQAAFLRGIPRLDEAGTVSQIGLMPWAPSD